MSKLDLIRAWRDPEYRASLSDTQQATLPDNPAGVVDLSDSDLESAAGGSLTIDFFCVPTFPGVCTLNGCKFTYSPPVCGDQALAS